MKTKPIEKKEMKVVKQTIKKEEMKDHLEQSEIHKVKKVKKTKKKVKKVKQHADITKEEMDVDIGLEEEIEE